MNLRFNSLLIILIVLIFSCKNRNNANENPDSDSVEIEQNKISNPDADSSSLEKDAIIEQVQGKWKEIDYPYRTAEFVNSTVKFVEEGTVASPVFETFDLSKNCPFENNNIRDLASDDIILTLPKKDRCEKMKIKNDTLTLSGFSGNTNDIYKIEYLKLK